MSEGELVHGEVGVEEAEDVETQVRLEPLHVARRPVEDLEGREKGERLGESVREGGERGALSRIFGRRAWWSRSSPISRSSPTSATIRSSSVRVETRRRGVCEVWARIHSDPPIQLHLLRMPVGAEEREERM